MPVKIRTVWLLLLLAAGTGWPQTFSLSLSTPRPSYQEEEQILLPLTIENTSSETAVFKAQYLQPKENTWLFIGKNYTLDIKVNGEPFGKFTNWMPPEPAEGNLSVALAPGQKMTWQVFFPWYYYPFDLPREFEVRLTGAAGSSNPVKFSVHPSRGTKQNNNLLINGDFTQGEKFPYGWRIENPAVVWDKAGHCLKYTLDRRTAENEGLWTYSLLMPVESPADYTFRMRAQSSAPEIIAFIEGWAVVAGRRRRVERTDFFAYPAGNKDFKNYSCTVKFTKPEIRWARVKLYTYLNPGEVRFSSVALTKEKR